MVAPGQWVGLELRHLLALKAIAGAVLEVEEQLPPRRIALASRRGRHTPALLETFVEEVAATCDELGLRA